MKGALPRDKCPSKKESTHPADAENLEKKIVQRVRLFPKNCASKIQSGIIKKISVTGIYLISLISVLQVHQGWSHGLSNSSSDLGKGPSSSRSEVQRSKGEI